MAPLQIPASAMAVLILVNNLICVTITLEPSGATTHQHVCNARVSDSATRPWHATMNAGVKLPDCHLTKRLNALVESQLMYHKGYQGLSEYSTGRYIL